MDTVVAVLIIVVIVIFVGLCADNAQKVKKQKEFGKTL